MRPERRRTKKLIVAFHFLRSDQSRWTCGACRKQGLERRRRCGFLPEGERGPVRVVWVHDRVGVNECPRSYVTPASVEIVESFAIWKSAGVQEWAQLSARVAEGFQVIEGEVRAEAGVSSGE